jgi:hypothetical protein
MMKLEELQIGMSLGVQGLNYSSFVVKTHLGYPKTFYFLLTELEGLASLPDGSEHVLCFPSTTFCRFM